MERTAGSQCYICTAKRLQTTANYSNTVACVSLKLHKQVERCKGSSPRKDAGRYCFVWVDGDRVKIIEAFVAGLAGKGQPKSAWEDEELENLDHHPAEDTWGSYSKKESSSEGILWTSNSICSRKKMYSRDVSIKINHNRQKSRHGIWGKIPRQAQEGNPKRSFIGAAIVQRCARLSAQGQVQLVVVHSSTQDH